MYKKYKNEAILIFFNLRLIFLSGYLHKNGVISDLQSGVFRAIH